MKSFDEFIKLSDDTLKEMLKKQGTHIPKNINHKTLLDYCTNKLHGIEFIHNDEKLIKGKITREFTPPKQVPAETCPSCTQQSLRKLRLPSNSQYHNYSHCSYCGLYLSPSEQKKPIEVKT